MSPAKSLDFETPAKFKKSTQPELIKHSAMLMQQLKRLNPEDIQELMKVSSNIATLNYQRFQNWHPEFSIENAKQCAYAFQGDVYKGLDFAMFDREQVDYAQQHLRILSGLYGVLKPLDLMQAYRLEMGVKFANKAGKNLYEFWGDTISLAIDKQLKKTKAKALVNLASNEYFKSIDKKTITVPIIEPVFKDFKNGQHKIISFYAKKSQRHDGRVYYKK